MMPSQKSKSGDMYIILARLKGRNNWVKVIENRKLSAIKEHLENNVKAEILELRTFKLNDVTGMISLIANFPL